MKPFNFETYAADATQARKFIDVSNSLSSGEWWLNDAAIRVVNIDIEARPSTDWGERVDRVEEPFAPKYDEQEYTNPALQMLNMAEFALLADSFNVAPPWDNSRTEDNLQNKCLLDVGCGTGRIALYGASLGANMTAVDQTEGYVRATAAKMARLSMPLAAAQLVVSPIESILDNKQKMPRADIVTAMFAVLNHCENWPGVVSDLADSLMPGGTMVTSWYGSPNAAIFKALQKGLPYQPAILVRRTEGGLLLGEEASEVLPARFPYSSEVTECMRESGLLLQTTMPLIPVTAFYPKDPTPENVAAFIGTVNNVFGKAISNYLKNFLPDPDQLLVGSLATDSLVEDVDCAAYYGIVATKEGSIA